MTANRIRTIQKKKKNKNAYLLPLLLLSHSLGGQFKIIKNVGSRKDHGHERTQQILIYALS